VHFSWKRWRLALTAVLAALALSVTFAGQALAAEPGEWGSWTEEHVGSQYLAARGTVGEARTGQGSLLQVWRGETNSIVWLSLNSGNAFQLTNPDGSSTETNFSPTVVPYGSNSFMVFHTGTDGRIYYAQVNPDGTWSGSWTAVGWGQSTNMAVSVTQVGVNSSSLYMVYHSSNDDSVYGAYYNGSYWGVGQRIAGGSSPAAPSVAYNPQSGLFVVVRGEDNQVWMVSSYDTTGSNWGSWTPQGGYTYVQPTIARSEAGPMLVSYVDENTYIPNYRPYGSVGQALGGWSQDITSWQTIYSVGLSVVSATVYVILTGLNGNVYYKEAYNPYGN
jgi:hypothetical protein